MIKGTALEVVAKQTGFASGDPATPADHVDSKTPQHCDLFVKLLQFCHERQTELFG